jgi:REP element-mobilizing transposase RayT
MTYSNLPHFNSINKYQFITFRTADSVDKFVKDLQDSELSDSQKQIQIDEYSDTSNLGAHLKNSVLLTLRSYILSLDKDLYNLVCFSIMPNHVHMLFQQKTSLSSILQIVKGGSAVLINKQLKKQGKFWAIGYYDRWIRNQKHFEVVYEYIQNNPRKAHLKDSHTRFYGIYDNELN